MPEAKSMTHMALTAMFAAMLLAAASALIGVGYMMWSAFSAQSATNERMQQFARYAAFDTASVRGQDVVSLIHDTQGDPVVIVIGPKHGKYVEYKSWSESDVGNPTLCAEPVLISGNATVSGFKWTDGNSFRIDNASYSAALGTDFTFQGAIGPTSTFGALSAFTDWANSDSAFQSYSDGVNLKAVLNFSKDSTKPSYEDLQQFFLSRGRYYSHEYLDANPTATITEKEGYLPYASFLIYDTASSDVAGVLLVEQFDADIFQ